MPDRQLSDFRVEVLVRGPEAVLEEIEDATGLRRAPFRSDFSLERLVPITPDRLKTLDARTALAARIHREVLTPWRELLAEEAPDSNARGALELEFAWIAIRACETIVPQSRTLEGIEGAEGIAPSRWLLDHWGCDGDVDDRPPQEPLSDEEDREMIHVGLPFSQDISTPPLLAFDALAARWPAVELTVLWDGGAKEWLTCGCGMTTWRYGMREESRTCEDDDRTAPYATLRSMIPLSLAKRIRDAGITRTKVRPHLRVDLTGDQFRELWDGESIELELGPDLVVSVGRREEDDFDLICHRLNGYDYCDGRGIGYDTVWHRIPGRVLGQKVVLTLHSTDAIEINRAETVLAQGKDPLLAWVRDCGFV